MTEKKQSFVDVDGNVVTYPGCFVCGADNESGLALRFVWDGETCVTEMAADERFAGYKNILHGGVLATVLDEVMIKAILAEGIVAVTGELSVKYKSPARAGDTINFTGKIIQRKSRLILTTGSAMNSRREIIAEASAKYVVVTDERFQDELTDSLREPGSNATM